MVKHTYDRNCAYRRILSAGRVSGTSEEGKHLRRPLSGFVCVSSYQGSRHQTLFPLEVHKWLLRALCSHVVLYKQRYGL